MIRPIRPALGLLALLAVAACGQTDGEAGSTGPSTEQLSQAATLAAACSGCHVAGGSAIVSLDGEGADAIVASLLTYKAETEGGTVMHRLARGYSETEIRSIAAYLAEDGAQ